MQNILKKLKRKISPPELFNQITELAQKAELRAWQTEKTLPDSGQILLHHTFRVADILAEITASKETIIAGIFYQFQKLPTNTLALSENAKKEIERIVSLTHKIRESLEIIKEPKHKPIKEWHQIMFDQQAENIRKIVFALTKDIRPILVLLSDELDDLEHLAKHYPEPKRKKIALMALEIFSPLCYGFGLENWKSRFDDAAFAILYPKEYQWLENQIEQQYSTIYAFGEKLKASIKKILLKNGFAQFQISSRIKSRFSLYQKLLKHEMDFNRIYDLVALRIIVPDIESCYYVLGILHQNFHPVPERFKDYISKPKENGYRALHTTLESAEKKFFEVQIKTNQMHLEAEYGVAAHLVYKSQAPKIKEDDFFWLKKIREWKEQTSRIEDLSSFIEKGVFKNRIFVFTPKGDLINLPQGATPIDFAFAIHSDIGEHVEAAMVNGKIVPLDYKLQDGERVQIIVDKNRVPSEKWLRFVKTQKAKNKISRFLETALGKSPPSRTQAAVSAVAQKVALLKKILPSQLIKKPQVVIGGESGIAFKFAKCCQPKPYEDISAFIDHSHNASVHRNNCPNLLELKEKWPQRVLDAQWLKNNHQS